LGLFKKVPFSGLPSDSEASLASLGMTKKGGSGRRPQGETPRLTPRGDKKGGSGDISHLVFPRHASAEGPPRLTPRDDSGRAYTKTFLKQPLSLVGEDVKMML
jgi:hypothetical protein